MVWRLAGFLLTTLLLAGAANAGDWWNKEWTVRKKLTIDTTANGGKIDGPIGAKVVLVRLHDGNFQFPLAKEDGSDLRFVAEDNKTVLSYELERFDGLLNEAFAWVRLPEIKANGTTSFWLYYGNPAPKPVGSPDAKATYASVANLVLHFAERNAPPNDATGNVTVSQQAGSSIDGALIGGGLRLTGNQAVEIPAAAPLAWAEGTGMTLSVWIKPAGPQPNSVLVARSEGDKLFTLGIEDEHPFFEVTNGGNTTRSPLGAPIGLSAWHQIAVVAERGKIGLYLDGESYASIPLGLPALTGPITLAGDGAKAGFQGDIDQLELNSTALPSGAIKFSALNQGKEAATKILAFAEDEQTGSAGHAGYFGVIVNSLTFDGWIVIGLLAVMAAISWWVMISKITYLNALARGNRLFMREWQHLATDLTALDHGDTEKVKSLGGRMDARAQRSLRQSSVYRIYRIGLDEIRHRLALNHSEKSLSSRSIQAIRAALDGGLVREKQRIDRLIVLLTICISGGPFLGLLGTVVGVMITFAAVAAAGDVNVNAIAPGIAAALLATVAGLAVAIPSLFGYNYIVSRVKDATADMHVFIDEFVTKMAEFYAGEKDIRLDLTPAASATMVALLRKLVEQTRDRSVKNAPERELEFAEGS